MTRRGAGREAQRRGSAHEAWVEDHLREAERLGILAHWAHNEPHGKYIRGGWEMVAPGATDYVAVSYDRGQTVALEAKARLGRLDKSEITREQQRHLDAVTRAGGIALLVVRLVEEVDSAEFQTDYAAPWGVVPWVTLKSAPSVGAEDLAQWEVLPDAKCFLERFCPVRGVPARSGRRHPRE